ncbi:hypothetical protein Tco_0194125 [Tanacetum coccineum]
MLRLGELSPALFERYNRDIGELFTMSGAVRDEIFTQRYRFRSLEHKEERVAVTFGAIWRPVLALKSWIAEERRAWLDLAEIVDSIRRGQEPRGEQRWQLACPISAILCKRFRSSLRGFTTSSPPNLPLRKRYLGTSELVEDDEEKEDNENEDAEEEDEEIEESSDSDSKSEGIEDEGPTTADEDPTVGDEGLAARDEGPGMRVESFGLGGDAAVLEGQQRATLVMETVVGEPLRLGYGALRCREITLGEGRMPSVFEDGIAYIDVPAYPPPALPVQTPPSPERLSGSLPISPAPSIIPLTISSPIIPLTVPSLVASPAMAETEGFLTEFGAQAEMQGGLIHDHTVRLWELSPALFERYDRDIGELFSKSGAVRDEIFSKRYQFRSLEHEQERVAVTFGAIWRPFLALES